METRRIPPADLAENQHPFKQDAIRQTDRMLIEKDVIFQNGKGQLERPRMTRSERAFLRSIGMEIFELTPETLEEMQAAGFVDASALPKNHPIFTEASRNTEVAIQARNPALEKKGRSFAERYQQTVAYSQEQIEAEKPGLIAIMGSAADITVVAFNYHNKHLKTDNGMIGMHNYAQSHSQVGPSEYAVVGDGRYRNDEGKRKVDIKIRPADAQSQIVTIPLVVARPR